MYRFMDQRISFKSLKYVSFVDKFISLDVDADENRQNDEKWLHVFKSFGAQLSSW